jgi:hypothetical protein
MALKVLVRHSVSKYETNELCCCTNASCISHPNYDFQFLDTEAAWVRQGGPAPDRQPLSNYIPRHLL